MSILRSATVSRDGLYRYGLYRGHIAPNSQVALFVGVNPSTADAEKDDATVRRMIGFCRRWDIGAFFVCNLFAWRATDVRDLARLPLDAAVGPEGDAYMRGAEGMAHLVIPCWGRLDKLPRHLRARADRVTSWLSSPRSGQSVRCLGYTKDGDPVHPLMVPYNAELVPFPAPLTPHADIGFVPGVLE